jgi:hypothetical protein
MRTKRAMLVAAALASGGAQGAQVIASVASASPRICHTGPVEMIIGGSTSGGNASCNATPPVAAAGRGTSVTEAQARVAPDLQRARDDERLTILHDELAKEQARLRTLEAAKTGSDPERAAMQVRTRDNIDALQHEIARLR